MKTNPLIICFCFLTLWIYVGFSLARLNSPTFDEPIHYQAGIAYQQGNYQFDLMEPPLVRRLVYSLSQTIHTNPRHIVTLTTGLLASLLIYQLAAISIYSGWLAALLFLSEPNLLAHSSLFTTDAISSFLAAITTLYILKYRRPSNLKLLSLAVLIGLTAASKIATLSLIVPLVLTTTRPRKIIYLVFVVALSALVIWATYDFRLQPPLKQISIPIPLGGYIRSLKENIQFAHRGHPLYFFEHLYTQGPWFKQFLVFLLKTPLLVLLLTLLTHRFLLPLSIIFLVHTFIGLHFGIRHLLTASILVILSSAHFAPRRFSIRFLTLMLVVIQFLSVYRFAPQFITFANPLAGHQPYRIFTDSDFDWGQGLVSLNSYLKQHQITRYQLDYFGSVNPANFVPPFMSVGPTTDMPTIISVTCYYQCGYFKNPLYPIAKAQPIAQSFFLFQ